MRWIASTLLLALVAGGEPAAAQSWATVPDTVAGFVVVDSTVFAQAALGRHWRFGSPLIPALWLDVYVYPLPMGAVCGQECSEAMARWDTQGFLASVPELIAQGKYDSVRVLKDGSASPAKDAWLRKGRRLDLEMLAAGEWRKSWYYVFAGRGTFLKVRASSLASTGETRKVVDDFVRAVTSTVTAPYACPEGEADDGIFQIAASFPVGGVPTADRIEGVFASEGYSLAYASREERRWISTSRFERFHGDTAATAEPQAVTVTGVAVFAGRPLDLASTGFYVGARALCKGVSNTDSRVVEMTAALSIIAGLNGTQGR